MTRSFNQRVICEHCGQSSTAESAFERWFRNEPTLASAKGIVRFDLDVLLHRYMFVDDLKSTREIQAMMFVEVKTHGAYPSDSQKDTLSMLNQVLRNRRRNMHGQPRRQVDGQPQKVYSKRNDKDVRLWMLGGHLLQLSGTCPVTSKYRLWDGSHYLEVDQLIKVFRFELNPDDPRKPLDIRRRSKPYGGQRTLFKA